MAVNSETTVRKIVAFPRELIAKVDEFRYANRIPTESEAIRRLIENGLSAEAPKAARVNRPAP